MFKAKGGVIHKTDADYLWERNPSAFGFTNNSAGSAWKLTKAGTVYKDESIYGFKDYSWLNGITNSRHKISGGEKVKTTVDGVGLRINKIIGPCINVGNESGAKWNDLRACPDNHEDTRKAGKVITRHMEVDWVPLVNQKEGKFDYLSNGMCMAKINYGKDNLSALYFVFGVGTGFKSKHKELNSDQMTWSEKNKLVSAGGSVCSMFDSIVKKHGFNLTLPLTYSGSFEGKLNENSVIILGSENGRTFYWNGRNGNEGYFGVLLGMLGQCRGGNNNNDAYEKCTGEKSLERKLVVKEYIYGGRKGDDGKFPIIGITIRRIGDIAGGNSDFYFKNFNWRKGRKTAKYIVEKISK